MADGVAAGVHRRTRVRHEVGHGLDARHTALLREGSDPSPLPPQRPDVPDDVRIHGELRAAAVARRGGTRQGIVDRQDARRRMAPLRKSAAAVRAYVFATWQEDDFHGRRVWAVPRVEPRPQPRLEPARFSGSRRVAAMGRGSEQGLSRHRRISRARHGSGGIRVDRLLRYGEQHHQHDSPIEGESG